MKKTDNLILFGDSQFAEIALEYFENYSPYKVVAFSVPHAYKKQSILHGLPVIDFEEIEEVLDPEHYKGFVSIAFSKLNRNREKMFNEAMFKGYDLVSFVHPRAFVASSAKLGKNVFLFEGNIVQSFVNIEDGVIGWSSNHWGHGSRVEKFAFISSHSVISGNCHVGKYSFLGVNSTISDGVTIGDNAIIGAGSLVVKSVPANCLVKGKANFPEEGVNTLEKFGINE